MASDVLKTIDSIYHLNQGQKEAAEAFFQFLFSEEKEFIISGSAGVGKTYLMEYIINNTLPRYYEICKLMGLPPVYNEIIMTATTNKAAEVLASIIKRATQTIHSFLNLRVVDDYTTGETSTIKTNAWMIHSNKIIFIDECSMIDKGLYGVIHEGTQNCKIVYVGDHNQLAPVQESLSPIYKHNTPFYELTQQMRNNKQPALMAVCDQLRQTVQTGRFMPIHTEMGVIELLDGPQMEALVQQHFAQQTLNSRILAYTNKRVLDYNDHIRTIRNLPVAFQPGELLINNSVFKLNKRSIAVEAGIEILKNNGSDVVKIGDVTLDVDIIDFKTHLADYFSGVKVPKDKDHYIKLIKYFASRKNWEKYFYLKNEFPDFRPRDAATVHKSQGSTYDTVFIDLGNISTCRQPDQAARMLYVAFSRAKSKVYLYGELSPKYGGLIQR